MAMERGWSVRTRAAVGLLAAVLSASPAAGQMFNNLGPSIMMNRMMLAPVTAQGKRVANGWDGKDEPQAADRPLPTATLSYTPSKQRRAANLAQFVAKSRAVDPQGAAAMEKLFAEMDVIDDIGRQLAPVGLSVSDVADAYAMWWIIAWYAQEGRESVLHRATAQAVRDQAARAMAATPMVAGLSDAGKQEFAEALLIQGAMVDAMNDSFRDDPAVKETLASSVRQGAQAMGLDLASMELTEEGFVPR